MVNFCPSSLLMSSNIIPKQCLNIRFADLLTTTWTLSSVLIGPKRCIWIFPYEQLSKFWFTFCCCFRFVLWDALPGQIANFLWEHELQVVSVLQFCHGEAWTYRIIVLLCLFIVSKFNVFEGKEKVREIFCYLGDCRAILISSKSSLWMLAGRRDDMATNLHSTISCG